MRFHKPPASARTPVRALAALSALGVLVGGLTGCGNKGERGSDAADATKSTLDRGIEEFDFDNAAFVDPVGEKQQFSDGHVTVEGYENVEDEDGNKVGWNIAEGPVFSDVDDDGDLDAAIVYTWTPASGANTYTGYLWTWEDGEAVQVEYPIRGGNYGAVKDLKAEKRGFAITAVSRPYQAPTSQNGGTEETFDFGLRDGFPAQTKPTFGAVDRCVISDDAMPGARGDGTPPRLTPDEDSPAIGDEKDFASILTVTNEDPHAEGWSLVRATRTDGSISCGWIKDEWATQG